MSDAGTSLILASSSPRRRELLSGCQVHFSIVVSDCDETPIPTEKPRQMVERLASMKAHAVAEKYPDAFVLGADTTVFIDDTILGKPESPDEAERMLSIIQGREHEVWGGISLVNLSRGIHHVESHVTAVKMASMVPEEIRWYIATGEPMDKAGSYAIQGIGLQFVEGIRGSYSNVVGLNIAATMRMLRKFDAL